MSIQALNQAELGSIGEILPRLPQGQRDDCVCRRSFSSGRQLTVFRAEGPLLLEYAAGMPLLVVFSEGGQQVFYLDRILRLTPGTAFAIAPLGNACAVNFSYPRAQPPQTLPPVDAACVEFAVSDLRFDRLYTYFRQEIRGDFYFRGEQHELYELVWLEQGVLHTVVNGQDVLLLPQELMIIDRNAWHIQFSDRSCRFITITFDMGSDLNVLVNRRLQPPRQLRPLLDKLLQEHTPQPYANDYAQALVQILLIELLRSPDNRQEAAPLPATLLAENRLLDSLLQYISRELHRRITLQELADFSHVSVPYLYKLFESHLGLPPGKFITKLRLDESKLLMRQGSMTIGQIAAQLGFSSVQHFSRQFHHCCGCTPSEYLRSVQYKP